MIYYHVKYILYTYCMFVLAIVLDIFPEVFGPTTCTIAIKQKAEGNSTLIWSKHRGGNARDYCVHKHEIIVLLPKKSKTCHT